MIDITKYYISSNLVPYENLALEEALLKAVPARTCILYLWQNRHTVVVGRNQNCWQECRCGELERNGGYLARRLSGGGAVYHDLGNLNFTFLVNQADYDLSRQLDVIVRAVSKFGIRAEKTGRNDLTIGGRKFSGNAFYQSGGKNYHHGTILLDVDLRQMSHYLNVSAQKLASKGVESVHERVVNLKELAPKITIKDLQTKLIEAFGTVYGTKPREIDPGELPEERIRELTRKYSSWEWIYGPKMEFTFSMEHRFPWGNVQLQLEVDQGMVKQAKLYSDAMNYAVIEKIPLLLKGCRFSSAVLAGALEPLQGMGTEIVADIRNLILEQEL